MFQKCRFPIVWSDSLNLPVYRCCALEQGTKRRTLRGDKQSARPCCPLQKVLLIEKVYHLNTLHLYPAQKLENEQRNNHRVLISSCSNTDIRLFDFYSKRGLGPDQSHYKQSWAQFCCKMWGDSLV